MSPASDPAAQLRALRERVDRRRAGGPPALRTPSSGSAAPILDPAMFDAAVERAVVARERRQAEEAARVERDRAEREAVGGPCRYCGVTRSWEHDGERDQAMGRWYPGPVCAWCEAERIGPTESDNRWRVLRKLLTRQQLGLSVGEYAVNRSGFRWWHEKPGAMTSETSRFAYVDRDELAARLATKPIEYATREPCERCGCPSLWWLAPRQGHNPEHWVCRGCAKTPDLEYLLAWASGLSRPSVASLGAAASQVLGVYWWREDPNGGRADPPKPCAVPFSYVDQQGARRRAWEVFGRSDWAAQRFAHPAAYEAARQAAQP